MRNRLSIARPLLVLLLLLGSSPSWAGFTVQPTSVTQTVVYNQPAQTFAVTATNTGTASLSLTWADSLDWFKGLQPAVTQTAAAGKSVTWTMPINTQQPYNCNPKCPMDPGTYTGTFIISGGGQTSTIPVILLIQPTAPPAPPGKVQGVSFIVETVPVLSWTANREPDLAGYTIYVSVVSGIYGAAAGTTTNTTMDVHGLKSGTTYYFTVTASDNNGNESVKSNEVTFTPS